MMFQGPLLFYATLIFLTVCARASLLNAQLTNNEVGRPESRTQSPKSSRGNTTRTVTPFAWSSWGSWSPCSRTCGGGVAVQERQCLPRDPSRWRRSRKRRKMYSSTERAKRGARDIRTVVTAGGQDCPGLAKRYHECNTTPCKGEQKEHRAEQCAAYDRRPFRGRFYTWVPYVDGNAPCTLNCRPRGQQFYASLGLVADGTPCTRPGFRAICVQGSCKVVGREGVLSASAGGGGRESRCGRRLVSGLFSRPRLPLGYSYVTTVPRGACRLNVSEMIPSDNYIALKLINGSYIMNGEFAVSAPGTYEAAGARFHYNRVANLDNVFTQGPIQHSIDIMILYTQPNPSIKYEYLTDAAPDDSSNEISSANKLKPQQDTPHQRHHRHHTAEPHTKALEHKQIQSKVLETQSQIDGNNIGDRKFTWKILAFTTCSRTCGGGLQIGKFKCAEVQGNKDKEVSPVHCSGSPPPPRRHRCGTTPCPPRWRAAPWGPCPVCGPAHRTRIVGCVQDHTKGLTKISDQNCPLPMPSSSEPCDIPNCDGTAATTDAPRSDTRRQIRPIERTDAFRDSPVISLTSNTSYNEVGPAYEQTFKSGGSHAGWLYTEWSECVGWCVGGGIQSRGTRCADPSGCVPHHTLSNSQTCKPRLQCDPHDGQWFTGEWSKCSAVCGGQQVRGVLCIGGTGRRLRDTACKLPKPANTQACGGTCAPSWYLSDWSECKGPCEAAIQTRTVWCARNGAEGAGGAARDTDCAGVRPLARRTCVPPRCSTRSAVQFTGPSVSESQQRVTRHQNHKTQDVPIAERTFTDGTGVCEDKLNNCVLAVQARLCHYRYYTEYCCRSCHGR